MKKLILLSLYFIFSCATTEAAIMKPATQKLSIAFDLAGSTLNATSQIEIPAGASGEIYLDDLKIQTIKLNGTAVDGTNNNTLQIQSSTAPQEVLIKYSKQFPSQISGPGEGIISEKGISLLSRWHPIMDRDMLFELSAIVPREFEAVSEADEIIHTSSTQGKKLQFHFPHQVRSVNFIAGPYEVDKIEFGQDKELYTYFFAADKELAEHYRSKGLGYLERYEKLIGPYPYKRYSIVENLLPTGYAMPTFTLLGQTVVRLPFIVDTSLGHEILHSWFGNSISVAEGSGNWTEGLTAYLADHAFEQEKGMGVEYRKANLVKYQSYVNSGNAMSVSGFFGAGGGHGLSSQPLRAIGYSKVAMIFHMLKNYLGDDNFHKGLQQFYQTKKYHSASWDDIKQTFEQVSGSSLDFYFSQWLDRKDVPHLVASAIDYTEENGEPVLSFKLQQHNEEPPYNLIVPIKITTSAGEIDKIVQMDTSEKKVQITLESPPVRLTIDPGYDLMRYLEPPELPPTWSRFAGAVNKTAIVGGSPEQQKFAPLIEYLKTIDCRIMTADEASDKIVAEGAVIFLGTDAKLARSLFAEVKHPSSGLTMDIRNNPLNMENVAVLVSSAGLEETLAATPKLKHYGKYSFLHFEQGRATKKSISPTNQGEVFPVDLPPPGISVNQARGFQAIMDEIRENRVIYVGEGHTTYADHQLQLRIIRALFERYENIAIGMEMFSHPSQQALDDYTLTHSIDEKTFLKESHYFTIWGYDYLLYRDILNFARANSIPVIALNLQKEMVSKVFKEGGPSALDETEQEAIPPDRDLDLPGYRNRLESVFTMHTMHGGNGGGEFKDFFQAQALWDETMAATAADYLQKNPQKKMIILAGRGHVVKNTGIPPRLQRRMPQIKQAVAVNLLQDDINPAYTDYVFFSPPSQAPSTPLMGVALSNHDDGVQITGVSPKGKAAQAGLQKGDIILAFDGEPVKRVEDIKIMMIAKKAGDAIQLRLKRKHSFLPDEELDVIVTL